MFDPYKKWLGIQPKDQPPNHYRLLSLDNFESDLDVIEGAADRQMGFIRQYQSGEHAAFAARLLNEIATARLCLLKPASKAEYDAKLKKQLPVPETTKEEFLPLATDPEIAEMMKAPKLERKRKRKKSNSPQGLWIAGAVVCVLIFGLLMTSSSRPPVLPSEPSADPVVESTPPTAQPASVQTPQEQTQSAQTPSSPTTPPPGISEQPAIASNEPQEPVKTPENMIPAPAEPALNPAEKKLKKSRPKTLESSELAGGDGGIPFNRDLKGKAMVGVIWTAGFWGGSNAISNIMPISAAGSSSQGGVQVIAPKGYAVGGIKVCAPKFVSHLQLIYMKQNDDGTLDPSMTKLSKWIGGTPKGEIVEISGEGKKVVGLIGRAAAVVDALGLVFEAEE